jgi:hypothetical protein
MFSEEGMHDIVKFGYLFGAFQGIFLWSIALPSYLVVSVTTTRKKLNRLLRPVRTQLSSRQRG